MVGIRGRVTDRVNQGRLGPKGLYSCVTWESLQCLLSDVMKLEINAAPGQVEIPSDTSEWKA